ncbi:hypothetical protein [Methylomonas sp. MgM2]
MKLLLPAMAAISNPSQAVDWLFEPDFRASERYSDNISMQANPANIISSPITTISPGILLGYQAENNQLRTHFNWNELIYHDASSLNFSEKILDLNHLYQGERFTTNLAAAYYEQSSINTQLIDPTLDITGQTLVPRFTRSISPGVTFFVTEKNSVQFNYSYQDVTFDRPQDLRSLRYSDYTNQQFSTTLTHIYSERLSFNLLGAYSLFDSFVSNSENGVIPFFIPINVASTTGYEQKSTNFFYQAGMQYEFDELTQLSLSAGMRFTENETRISQTLVYDPEFPPFFVNRPTSESNVSSKANGHVFSADFTRKGEWGNFALNAGQQLNPSSSGSQQQTTSFGATANYNIDERWTTGINANYRISEYTSTFSTVNSRYDSTYTTVTPRIRWRWTPEINLELSYTFAQREYTSQHQTSTGNNVQLQFSYHPQINRQVQ